MQNHNVLKARNVDLHSREMHQKLKANIDVSELQDSISEDAYLKVLTREVFH